MKLRKTEFDSLEIHEAAEFEEAGIILLSHCLNALRKEGVKALVIPSGKGVSRLANLLCWDIGESQEYVDEGGLFADQVIHTGLHHVVEKRLGSQQPEHMLFAEVIASASDIYLLGKLAQAGLETEFLSETLESFGFYYEQYALDDTHYETLLGRLSETPFATMVASARFLFSFCAPLLQDCPPDALIDHMGGYASNIFYPLAHHYNVSNWVLAIRAKFGPLENFNGLPDDVWASFLGDEAVFLDACA